VRLFLALELSEEARAALSRAREIFARSLTGWRFVDPAAVHLTLRFLGEVDPEKDRAHRRAWGSAVCGFAPVRFQLTGAGVFPGPARPRVLWIGVREDPPEGRIEEIARALEGAARAEGFPPEDRPFHPHLTLARARRDVHATPPRDAVGELGATVECAEVVLFRSDLGPAGARYSPLDAFPLAGTGPL